jgi:dienelactone hydrolase
MKKRWVVTGVLLLLFVVFFSQIRLGFITALFLWDLLDETTVAQPDRGKLAWVTPEPSVKPVEVPQRERKIPADLYYVVGAGKRGAILLTHGIIESGKDDPRLIRFARSLARAGFVVLVPELKGMKSFRVLLSDVDDIVASFHYMASLKELVNEKRMGLMGFSYAAGPTIMAAADAAIRDQVGFVISFGGYYDPVNIIRFITTGYYEYGYERGFLQPEPYGKWVFFMNNVDYVESEKDRKILKQVFQQEATQITDDIAPLLASLTPKGRYLYELLINTDPQRVDDLVKNTDPRFQDYLQKLSMAPLIPVLRGYLIVGHGTTDTLIPYTESLRLANAVPDKRKVHLAILRLFGHVDPSKKRFAAKEFLTVYLPSIAEFYYLVYDLLNQQN